MKKNHQKSPHHRHPNQEGGKRLGAGRKPGIPNKVTQELRDKVLASGKTPLEVMTDVMNELLAAAHRIPVDGIVIVNEKVVTRLVLLERAAIVAKDAAPYLHPKLQSIECSGKDGEPIQHCFEVEFVSSGK